MKIILFSLLISIILSISYSLISIKKINFKSIFAFVLDLAIIGLTIYVSIKIIDKYINEPLSLIFIITGLIIFQLLYFSIFRKIIYRFYSSTINKNSTIENYIFENYKLRIKVYKGNFKHNIIFIPFFNQVLINSELVENLDTKDLSNSILFESKGNYGNIISILNYLIPAIIFYYAFTEANSSNKTLLIVVASITLIILKKITTRIIAKIGIGRLKGKIDKDELKKSYTNYFNFLFEKSSKIEKVKKNILLRNKISMIEKAL